MLSSLLKQNGSININSIIENDHLKISVSDNGIGIANSDKNMIFEKFRQVDSSKIKPQQGAGLGLAICRKLVELHGGEINLNSEKGKGSCFWFILPLLKHKI